MPVADPTIPDCLRPEVCPNCAYSLAGLPDPSRCPECGRLNDPSEIILYGWGRGRHENIATAKKSRLFWLFGLSIFGLVLQSFIQLSIHSPYRNLILTMLAAVILVNILLLARRSNVDHPGMIQVRLNDLGCVQYDSLNGPGTFSELMFQYGGLALAIVAAGMLFAYLRGWAHAIIFWTWFPMAVVLSSIWWYRSRGVRHALAAVDPKSIADRNAAFRKTTPWSAVSDFSLGRPGGENYHLTIRHRSPFFHGPPIEAEIKCTMEQAEQLRKWLNRRIAMVHHESIPE